MHTACRLDQDSPMLTLREALRRERDDQLADLSPGPVVRPRSREGSCIDCLRLGPRKRLSPDVSACRNSEIKDHEDRCGASCTDNELFAQAEIDLDHTGNLGTEGTPTEREHRKDDANL